jgi:hypothetical protein
MRAAFVVVPAIVHEGDATIDRAVDQPGRLGIGDRSLAEVEAAHADGRDRFARPAERAVEHLAAALTRVTDEAEIGRIGDAGDGKRRGGVHAKLLGGGGLLGALPMTHQRMVALAA